MDSTTVIMRWDL